MASVELGLTETSEGASSEQVRNTSFFYYKAKV